jgi:hypothetical protein
MARQANRASLPESRHERRCENAIVACCPTHINVRYSSFIDEIDRARVDGVLVWKFGSFGARKCGSVKPEANSIRLPAPPVSDWVGDDVEEKKLTPKR